MIVNQDAWDDFNIDANDFWNKWKILLPIDWDFDDAKVPISESYKISEQSIKLAKCANVTSHE